MALEVGSVFARLGARLDDDGFDRWERRFSRARADARRPVEAELKADVDTRGFDRYNARVRDVDRGQRDLIRGSGRLRTSFSSLFIGGAGLAAGAAGFVGLAKGAQAVVGAFGESEAVAAQTEARLKSTGGAANVTAQDVDRLATSLSRKTGVDDEVIASSENVLLTFTKVRNEAGEGNKIFDRATVAALDLSKALGTDLQAANLQVGKALNDPIKGVTSLGRAGVQFTKEQKETIKTLVESGDQLGAQKIILEELETQVGGSAEAYGRTLPGAIDKAKVAVGNIAEAIGGRLAPFIERGANALANLINGAEDGERSLGGLGRVVERVGSTAGRVFAFVRQVVDDNRDTFEAMGRNVGQAASLIGRLLTAIGAAFRRTFGPGSGTGRDVRNIIRVVLQIAEVVQRVYLAVARRALPGIIAAFQGFFRIVRGIVRVISGVLTGDFGRAWEGVKDIFGGGLRAVGGIIRAATAPIRTLVAAIARAIETVFGGAWDALKSIARSALDALIGGLTTFMGFLEDAFRLAGKIPGIGDKFDDAADAIRRAREKLDGFRQSLRDTPSEKRVRVMVDAVLRSGNRLVPLQQLAGGGDGLGLDYEAIASGLVDDAWAQGLLAPQVSGSGLNAFNHLAPLFGVSVGSGVRPGSRTSSGNTSYHALGRARDFPGPPGAMLGFARFLANTYGPRLLELIHTPMGFGIKNGRRVSSFGQKVDADHYDHVHVAMQRGGRLDRPVFLLAGEDAPNHPEYFIPTNPAFRDRALPLLAEAAGALGARVEAFQRGGRRGRRPPRPRLSPRENRGIQRSIRRGEKGIGSYEREIQNLERTYGQKDREFGLDAPDLLVEQEDGSIVVDESAVADRVGELDVLIGIRNRIKAKIDAYRDAIVKARAAYARGISKLTRALRRARGKSRAKERSGYRERIDNYRERRGELATVFEDLAFDLEDSRIDLLELQGEKDEVGGTAGTPAPPAEPPLDAGVPDAGPEPPAPEPAAPSPEEIARAAAAELASFQAGRAELFGTFGQNFARAGQPLFATPEQLAAGLRFFGAASGDGEGVVRGGGAPQIVQHITFGQGPPNEHLFAQATLHEMRAAL